MKLRALALVSTALLIASGCSAQSDDERGSDADTAVDAPAALNGTLRACMDISFPPMEYYPDESTDEPAGVDVDLTNALAEQMGIDSEIIPTAFDGLLPALSAQRCDVVISGILITEERTEQVPAVGYIETHQVVMVPGGNPDNIETREDLSGLTVALEGGTQYENVVAEWNEELAASGDPEITVHTYPKQTDAVQQLLVGRADAVVTQDTEAAYRMTTDPDNFEVAVVLPDVETFGIYYNERVEGLGEAVEEAVENLNAEGVIDSIAEEHNLATEVE